MVHSPEQIISWATNQPSKVQQVQEGWYHTLYIFNHDAMKLEVDSKKKNWTDQKYLEIMNILLENEWSNQEIKEEI